MTTRIAPALALLVAACAAPASSVNLEIVSGEAGFDSALVFFRNDRAGSFCTGAAISPRHVVVARACVVSGRRDELTDASFLFVASDARGSRVPVAAVHVPPEPFTPDAPSGHDLAILTLERTVSESPFTLRRAAPDDLVGRSVRAAGYGATDVPSDEAGRLRTRSTAIVSVTGGLMRVDGTFCLGDGALYTADRALVGIAVLHLPTPDEDCGPTTAALVDSLHDDVEWIEAVVGPDLPSDDAGLVADAATGEDAAVPEVPEPDDAMALDAGAAPEPATMPTPTPTPGCSAFESARGGTSRVAWLVLAAPAALLGLRRRRRARVSARPRCRA